MAKNAILWEGKPQYKPRLAILEIAGGGGDAGPASILVPVALVLLVTKIILSIYNDNTFNTFAFSLLFAAIIIVPELHKYIRRSKTIYQLRENSISITNYWYGSTDRQILEFKHIEKLYLVNYKDDIGEIHIFVKEGAPKIVSRNFFSGTKGFNVILYDIKDSAATYKKFEIALKESKNQ